RRERVVSGTAAVALLACALATAVLIHFMGLSRPDEATPQAPATAPPQPQAAALEQHNGEPEVAVSSPGRETVEPPVTAWSKTRPPVSATVAWAKAPPTPEQKMPVSVAAAPQVL